MSAVAFVTCADYAELAPDDRLAVAELARIGIDVVPWIWDQPAPRDTRIAVIRSCWDYHLKTTQFRAWLHSTPHALLNPPATALWNLDKRYLRDIAAWKHAVPRMVWIEPKSRVDLEEILAAHTFEEVVVKPTVGMLGIDTFRVTPATASARQADLDRILADRGVMIQEFIAEVLTEGEISLMFIGGEYSHAIRKRPAGGEFRIQEEYGGRREPFIPPGKMVAKAGELLANVAPDLLYARVDGIPRDGELILMEVELIDPHMFLAYHDEAPRRFAHAVASRVAQDGRR